MPRADLRMRRTLYNNTGSSTAYGPNANNIGMTVVLNSSRVSAGFGAPSLIGGYLLVRILAVNPQYLCDKKREITDGTLELE